MSYFPQTFYTKSVGCAQINALFWENMAYSFTVIGFELASRT